MGSLHLSTCVVLLALHAAGLAVAATDPPKTTICGLDGFQLGTLEAAPFWNLTVTDRSNCIIPSGVAETDIDSCTVHFSICQPLPPGICDGLTNSSICEMVTLKNGTRLYYDIGHYRGNNEFGPLVGDTVGFTTLQQGSQTIDGRNCKSTYDTFLVWTCDQNRVWTAKSPDVSDFVTGTSNLEQKCVLRVTMGYSGACYDAPTLAPDVCQLSPYDLTGLDSKPPRKVSVTNPKLCYNGLASDCSIYMSFCGALPLQSELGINCYGASVCQTYTVAGKGHSYSMGQFRTAEFKENSNVTVGGGFHFSVENGTRPEDGKCNHTNGIKTTVVLLCDPTAVWKDSDISEFAHVSTFDPLSNCEYIIDLYYDGACESVGPIGPVGPSKRQSPQSFVGWILISIFFFAVIVYLFVGAGFQYFVKGARGVEVIPNYAFWILFLSLVLEGFKFSFNAITCFKFEGTIKNPLSGPGKSSVDYDKI